MADYSTLRELTSCEKDATLLGTIAGSTYHEVSYILRTDPNDPNGNHQIVGRASDWPVIQLRAELAESQALLIALTRQAEASDRLALTLRAQLDAAAQREAATRAELDQAALIPPAMAAAATGLTIVEPLVPCPETGCGKQFKNAQAVIMHRQRAHGYRAETAAPAQEPHASEWTCATCGRPGTPSVNEPHRCKRCVRAVVLMQPGWRCANVACSGAFTQSLKNAAYCTECAKTQPIGSSNGHALEVGGSI